MSAAAAGVNNDTTYTKLFVGGLAWEARVEELREHFKEFGELAEAVVIYDKDSGKSKGYGFVTYFRPEDAQKALADPYPVIASRRANCNLAAFGRKSTHTPQFEYYGGFETGYGPEYFGGMGGFAPPDPYWAQQYGATAAGAPNPNFPPIWPYGPGGAASVGGETGEQAKEAEKGSSPSDGAINPSPSDKIGSGENDSESSAPKEATKADAATEIDNPPVIPAGPMPPWMMGYPGWGAPMFAPRPPWMRQQQGPPGWSRESALAAAAAGIHPVQWIPPDPEAQQSIRKQFAKDEDKDGFDKAKKNGAGAEGKKESGGMSAESVPWQPVSRKDNPANYWGGKYAGNTHGINLGAVGIPLSAQFSQFGRGRGRGGYHGGGNRYYNYDPNRGRTQRVMTATASVSTSEVSDAATNTPGPQKDEATSTSATPAKSTQGTSTDSQLASAAAKMQL